MATLSLLRDVVLSYGNVVEGQLDRLLPLLLSKGAEAKEQVRTLCYEVLCGKCLARANIVSTGTGH